MGTRPASEHDAPLAALGIPVEIRARLGSYLDLLERWNERTNLTGARTPSERVRILIADPWIAARHVLGPSVIDVGSGNGSPGLVLGLIRPDLSVTLLEPRARRWAFLREASRALGSANVQAERRRAAEHRGVADCVTMRGVGLSLVEVAPLVRLGGQVLLFGGEASAAPGFREAPGRRLVDSELHEFRRER